MRDYDGLLRTLDFNGDHLRDTDAIAAAYMREAASAIRHLSWDREHYFRRMTEETAANHRITTDARRLERELTIATTTLASSVVTAAPDLLAACEEALEAMNAAGVLFPGDLHEGTPVKAQLHAAILRAQGIEAGTGETREAGLDAKHESPVGKADAPDEQSA